MGAPSIPRHPADLDTARLSLSPAAPRALLVRYDGKGYSRKVAEIIMEADGPSPTTAEIPIDSPLGELLEGIAIELVCACYNGFETNKGAHGTVTFNASTGTLTIDHTLRVSETVTHTVTLTSARPRTPLAAILRAMGGRYRASATFDWDLCCVELTADLPPDAARTPLRRLEATLRSTLAKALDKAGLASSYTSAEITVTAYHSPKATISINTAETVDGDTVSISA
jgi:hypothetical protein